MKSINIEDNFQGKGFGKFALEEFIEESTNESAEAILLLADAEGGQRDSFILTLFYEQNDFEVIYDKQKYPLLLGPSEVSFDIKDKLEEKFNDLFLKNRNLVKPKRK